MILRLALGVALLAGGTAATAQDAPLPTGSTLENDISSGKAPAGLAPPPADRRIFEGDWYPFRSGPSGPPPGGGPEAGARSDNAPRPPRQSGAMANDENAPYSFQQCAPQPVFLGGMGVAIVQNATTLLVLNEETQNYRVVFLDAKHPAEFTPNRNGNSVGHWEGDALVIDTIGLTAQGGGATDAHVVERLRRTGDGTVLEDQLTTTESGRTSTRASTWRWRPDIKINESVCEEGYGQFQLEDGKLQIKDAK